MFTPRVRRVAIVVLLAMLPGLVGMPASAYGPDDPPATPAATKPAAGPAAADPAAADPAAAGLSAAGAPGPAAPRAGRPARALAADADEDGGVDPATPAEKIQAATVVGLDTSLPSNPIGLNDRDFTFELWLLAKPGSEVRGTALLSLGDWDPDAQTCVACTLYIRRGIKEAAQRDTANEIRDRQTAQAAESRRQQAADLVEVAVTPRLIASSDRDFTISVWNFLTQQKPRFTATIAAAQAAFTTDAAKVDAFLTGGLATAFEADQKRIIEEDTAQDEAARAEAKRRFARKYAANVVGVNAKVDDAAWMTTSDDIFLRDLARKLRGDQFWTLTYTALADEVLNGTPDSWKQIISTGIFDLVEQDRVRRNKEIMKVYSDYVRWVRDDAVSIGHKNVARAATAALATNSIAKLWDFIGKRDALPKDSSELTLLHAQGTSVQIRTRSEAGRWVTNDRLLWKSAAGAWNFANSRIVSGDFDGDSKRDALLLHWGPTQLNAWFLTNVDGTVRAPVSVWLSSADSAGKNYQLYNMAVGDFNGDGRSELVVFAKNKAGKTVILHLTRNAAGAWTHKETPVADALLTGRHVAGDVNNDKKEDLITLQQDATKGLQIWVAVSTATSLGTPAAKWADKNFVLTSTNNPVAVDTDNNGVVELALFRQEKGTKSDNGASLHIFSNLNGTPTRAEKWRAPGGMGAKKIHAVAEDVNGDDYTDLLLHYAVVDNMTMTYVVFNGPAGFHRVRLVMEDNLKIAELRVAES
jgi:hypothetical protein